MQMQMWRKKRGRRGKNSISIITVRKIYKKYIFIELLQKKRHIDIDYYVS